MPRANHRRNRNSTPRRFRWRCRAGTVLVDISKRRVRRPAAWQPGRPASIKRGLWLTWRNWCWELTTARRWPKWSPCWLRWAFAGSTLAEIPDALEVDETGDSFAANAALKAAGQRNIWARWVLGEDSGLVVDVLQGRPGIFSAMFSGEQYVTEPSRGQHHPRKAEIRKGLFNRKICLCPQIIRYSYLNSIISEF